MSAVASVIDSNDPEEIDGSSKGIPDPVGSFYRFSLAGSSCDAAGTPPAPSRPPAAARKGSGESDVDKETSNEPAGARTRTDQTYFHRSDHAAGRPRQDRHLPERRGRGGQRLLQIPELRGFERFCVGRPAEDMPNLTNRICGVCPEAHHMAATKALDGVFHVDPPPAAKKLRELFYSIFFATDHTTHFYALAGPDFVVGPDRSGRRTEHPGRHRQSGHGHRRPGAQDAPRRPPSDQMIGGRPRASQLGPAGRRQPRHHRRAAPGDRATAGREAIEFAQFSLQVFDDVVLSNSEYVDLIKATILHHRTTTWEPSTRTTTSTSTTARSASSAPTARSTPSTMPRTTRLHRRAVEPWSYLKFPYLKKIGWKGFVDGVESGVYKATPLSRLNAADGMATPLAQAEYEKFYETSGRQAGASHAGHPLGAADRVAVRRRELGGTGHGSGDHQPRIPRAADGDAHRGRGQRRGAARHADPPLHDRRARPADQAST
jgi:hypothetical protein